MGQIFFATAYDIETKTCCVIDADKFHANCYSFCGIVLSMHYLLRQKPYRIMWGGAYVAIDNNLEHYSKQEDLLGLSTYMNYENFDNNVKNVQSKCFFDKVKFIDENHKSWKRISVWDKALEYFDWDNTNSVKYSGYLINHTQKLAVNLENYITQSLSLSDDRKEFTIDLLPVLTETGDGTQMALLRGLSANSTEKLSETWCGDLLQIVDDLPEGYKIINCCFVEIWGRVMYCYKSFGTNDEGLILNDFNGELFEAVKLNAYGKRSNSTNIRAEVNENAVNFRSVEKV